MADIIDISTRFRKALPSLDEIAAFSIEDIMNDWARFARNNRLNEFFLEMIPSYVDAKLSYMSDLNAVANLEQHVRLTVMVMGPGFDGAHQLGWRAGFRLNGQHFETPDFISEAYARCCAVLLFLKMKRELISRGMSVTE